MWFLYVLWWARSLLNSVFYEVELDIFESNRTSEVLGEEIGDFIVSVELSKLVFDYDIPSLFSIENTVDNVIDIRVSTNMAEFLYGNLAPLAKGIGFDETFLSESIDQNLKCSSLTRQAKEKLPNLLETLVFNSTKEDLLVDFILDSYQLDGLCLEPDGGCGVLLTESFLRSKLFHSQNSTEIELKRSCEIQERIFKQLLDIEDSVVAIRDLTLGCLAIYILLFFGWTILFNLTNLFDLTAFSYVICSPVLVAIYQGILCFPLIVTRYIEYLELKSLLKELTQNLEDEAVFSESLVINLDSSIDVIELLLKVDGTLIFFAAACAALLGLIFTIFLFIYIQFLVYRFLHFMNTGFLEPFIVKDYYRVE
eukprot:snap_masked-scaffold_7-processed-gene-18.34-mRNA-1 protein AED:1.00 eAED:1.00 QI:0/-1/0/0/-1/1/1/0/366